MEYQDIDSEYLRIFGEVHYPSLYNKDDLSYCQLRKEIIKAPRVFASTRGLPFEGVCDFLIEEEIDHNRNCPEPAAGKDNIIACNVNVIELIEGVRNYATTTISGILSSLGGHTSTEKSKPSNTPKNKDLFWNIFKRLKL